VSKNHSHRPSRLARQVATWQSLPESFSVPAARVSGYRANVWAIQYVEEPATLRVTDARRAPVIPRSVSPTQSQDAISDALAVLGVWGHLGYRVSETLPRATVAASRGCLSLLGGF